MKAGPAPSYEDFQASALFCRRCRMAVPVRERLLLVLPDGELREYRCGRCADSLGTKKISQQDGAAGLVRP